MGKQMELLVPSILIFFFFTLGWEECGLREVDDIGEKKVLKVINKMENAKSATLDRISDVQHKVEVRHMLIEEERRIEN